MSQGYGSLNLTISIPQHMQLHKMLIISIWIHSTMNPTNAGAVYQPSSLHGDSIYFYLTDRGRTRWQMNSRELMFRATKNFKIWIGLQRSEDGLRCLGQMGTGKESGVRAVESVQATWPPPSSNHRRRIKVPHCDNTTNFTKVPWVQSNSSKILLLGKFMTEVIFENTIFRYLKFDGLATFIYYRTNYRE